MARRGAARLVAAPLLLLLLAWHVRPAGCGGDNVLQRLWAKVPPRRTETPAPPAAHGSDPGANLGETAGISGQGAAGSGPGTSAGAPGGTAGGSTRAGAGAGAAGAAGAAGGAAVATATGWVPNVRKRGRPKGSKNKMPRAKRPPRESTASTLLSASRGRLPGSRGPQPGAGCARWSVELKAYALALYDLRKSLTDTVTELLRTRPGDYGRGRVLLRNGKPAAALSVQILAQWVEKRSKAANAGSSHWFDTAFGGKRAGAGRHRLIPAAVLERIRSAWKAVLATKKTLFTIVQLRSVAVGVLISAGYGALLTAKHSNGTPVFACSRDWVAKQCTAQGWSFKKPFGDADKPPENMHDLIRNYLHRIAYFVKVYNVPKELVINPDHTGLHYTQIKGGGWTDDAGTPAVASGGDKRECTFVPCSSAAGRVCPTQLVFGGTTSQSMSQGIGKYKSARVAGPHIEASYKGYGGQLDESSVADENKLVPKWIHHFAGTGNHWSDLVTSIDILVFVLVPFLKSEIARCSLPEASHAILILDCWWGWTSPLFKAHVHKEYPWVHLIYVPGRCTPWAQPADRGYITRLKACLRKYSSELITSIVVRQLFTEGRPPSEVDVDIKGATSCKTNLAKWVSQACEELNATPDVVQKYWSGIGVQENITTNGLLDAWEPAVQAVAWERRGELFPNLRTEDDPTPGNNNDYTERIEDTAAAGFGDEEPGIEQDLQAAGVLRGAPSMSVVSHEEAVAFLDDFVARFDARMAAAGTPVPPAGNVREVIAEVQANLEAPESSEDEEADEEADEDEDEDEEAEDAEADVAAGGAEAGGATPIS